MKHKKCVICETPLTGSQQKFCSKKCTYKDSNRKYNNKQAQYKRGLMNKITLIQHLGGKCQGCGYDKNYSALSFHHNDESQKSFGLDIRKCSGTNINTLIEEANKCTLLCHNCHMEHHYPHMDKKLVGLLGIEPRTTDYESDVLTS